MSFERVERSDDDARSRVESGGGGPPWKLLLVLGIVAVVAVFVFQNNDRSDIDLLFFTFEDTRLWVALLIAVAFGVILDRIVVWWWRRARRRARRDDD